MDGVALSDSVKAYLRKSGYSQKELASELGLNPRVLSRKLNGKDAYLTHQELQRIITQLAEWHAITTKDEALHLLDVAQVEAAIFSDDEWEAPPLSTLVKKHTAPVSAHNAHSIPDTRHNLPHAKIRLIGREWPIERLQQLLGRDDVRLVTLVGSGGCGKTSLAQHVASELVNTFAQGVWFVALAGQRDPAMVPVSILQALHIQSMPGLSPLQTLINYLKNKHLLLVLDNFEQVGEAASAVDEMLAEVPGLKVLVTSRVVLHLYGEHEFSVTPLDVPDPGIILDTAEFSQYPAVQLFIERTQAMLPEFALTAENAATIAQICARVDGLPLALELAAARVKVLPPAQLLERLTKARLPLLTRGARNLPGRQQTLYNTIKWSYDLLSKTEQAWFRSLGIFNGGWSLEAAEAMMHGVAVDLTTTDSSSPMDILEQLGDNSLLVCPSVTAKQARFTMLETLREYALEQLVAQGEYERLRDWHTCYYLQEAEIAEIGLRGSQQLVWLEKLKADRDNFRAALEWSLQRAKEGKRISAYSGQAPCAESQKVAGSTILHILPSQAESSTGLLALELCLRLASSLRHSWEWQGNLTEARHWLRAALAVPLGDESSETLLAARAKALSEASRLMCLQNDQESAVALAEESITLARQLDDPIRLASTMLHRGWAAHAMSDYNTARDVYRQGLQSLATTDDPWMRGQLLFHLAAAEGFAGNVEEMWPLYTQGRELFEQLNDNSSLADLLKDQGGMSLFAGNGNMAINSLLKSLKLCYDLDHKQHITTSMCILSLAFGMNGKPEPSSASLYSAQLEGVAKNLEEMIGFTPWTESSSLVQTIKQYIRSQVDEQSWNDAVAMGRKLTLEQAIDLAHQMGEETR